MLNPVASTAKSGPLGALSPSLTPAGTGHEAADFKAILQAEAHIGLSTHSAITLPGLDAKALEAATPAGNSGKLAGKILPGLDPLADLTELSDDVSDGSVTEPVLAADDDEIPVPALLFAEPIRTVSPELAQALRFDPVAGGHGQSRAAFAALAAQLPNQRSQIVESPGAAGAQNAAEAPALPLPNQTGAASLAAFVSHLQGSPGQLPRIVSGRAGQSEMPTASQALTAQAGSGQAGSAKPGRSAEAAGAGQLPAAGTAMQAPLASASHSERTSQMPLEEHPAPAPRTAREDTASPTRNAPAVSATPAFTMAVEFTSPAASPLSQAILSPAVPANATGPVSTSFATANAAAEQPQDVGTLVDRLVEAREAAMPHIVRAAVSHGQFGSVALQFQNDDSRLSVTMTSADPDFAPAVHAAAAQAAASASSDQSASQSRSEAQARQEQQQQAQQQASTAAGSNGQSQAQSQADTRSSAERESVRGGQQGNGSAEGDQTQPDGARRPGRQSGIYA